MLFLWNLKNSFYNIKSLSAIKIDTLYVESLTECLLIIRTEKRIKIIEKLLSYKFANCFTFSRKLQHWTRTASPRLTMSINVQKQKQSIFENWNVSIDIRVPPFQCYVHQFMSSVLMLRLNCNKMKPSAFDDMINMSNIATLYCGSFTLLTSKLYNYWPPKRRKKGALLYVQGIRSMKRSAID